MKEDMGLDLDWFNFDDDGKSNFGFCSQWKCSNTL